VQRGLSQFTVTGGLSARAADLKIMQNESFTIPHPLRGSSLCTREPKAIES